ncbi:B3 domain-containing transcription factor ABI3 [Andrographis paniculata]|uniref:B3 domain-containing transcription factor ABI3 n=1 Tax=Andrographis paniculata TaxID=175694 RepID=UPI0021E9AA23|nr:B3 domain-containing transcription factor ABI3 [Andrographis paniculata]XP_051134474.1 B3 domain-containing transcription factor ABI3 [Andrographis paniculata]
MIMEEVVDVGGNDLYFGSGGGGAAVGNPNCFDPMEEDNNPAGDVMAAIGEKDLENLLDVNDSAIFYNDFPPLPDFPCMSSSSSSSSTPEKAIAAAAANSTSTSSAATSSAVMKSDNEEAMSFHDLTNNDDDPAKLDHGGGGGGGAALSSTASMEIPPPADFVDVDCIDFNCMDLIDTADIWDPSSVFQTENPLEFLEDHHPTAETEAIKIDGHDCSDENGLSFLQGNSELAVIFLEWLKQNKDYISADDMRTIKLKRSTIENASKRLGSSKEGKKQLLKLILEWVGQYQLQKKRSQDLNQNPNFTPNLMTFNSIPNCFPTTPQWIPPPQGVPAPPYYGGAPYSNTIAPMSHQIVNGIPYPPEYPVMEHAQSWPAAMLPYPIPAPATSPAPFSPFSDGNMASHQQTVYGNPYPIVGPNGERLMRMGSSATKEARKKRMARQRRLYTHHHHHHRHGSTSNHHQNQIHDPNLLGDAADDCDPANWLCCPHGDSSPGTAPPPEAVQPNSGDRQSLPPATSQQNNRRQQQGWKTEKNLKFLLQKVLKQSDVGNLGRIVLPKKEAESHLPELETRDGIPIAMEDIGTSRVWNMRYRYWPNNKSRMYLLENTGDFVRVNGLQEGDFIVIYSDTKCGKYMIRGVKVRQPGAKQEGKKPARRNMRNLSIAGNSSSLIKQAVR